MSAKYELYTKHMSAHIKSVQYRSDGAANLACILHYLVQPMWKIWTGINEEVCKYCPAGEGKSELDGNFGQTSHVLSIQHDLSHSYNDAVSIVTAFTADGSGLSGTTFVVFLPGRKHISDGKMDADVCGKSVLRSTLQSDSSLVTHQHTGYGVGTRIYPNLSSILINDGSKTNIAPLSFFDGPKNVQVFRHFLIYCQSFMAQKNLMPSICGGCGVNVNLLLLRLDPFSQLASNTFLQVHNAQVRLQNYQRVVLVMVMSLLENLIGH